MDKNSDYQLLVMKYIIDANTQDSDEKWRISHKIS